MALSSCLIQIPITHAFHAVANRDGHIGRGDLADRTTKYYGVPIQDVGWALKLLSETP